VPVDIPNLLHADRRQFEHALVELTNRRRRAKLEIRELLKAIDAFDSHEALPHSERSRRVQLLLAAWKADRDELVEVADYAARLGATIRNALLTCLPSEIQQRIYQSGLRTAKEPASPAASESAATKPRPPTETPPLVEAAEQTEVEVEDRRHEGSTDHKVVLLLGAADKHEANITLLKAKGFEPVRAFSAGERDNLLKSFVCGIVVDGSWWSLFPAEQHSEELRRVVAHSTFAFVRVDLSGLSEAVGAQFSQLVTEIRFRDPSINECAWGDSARLTTTDVAALNQAASILATRRQCRFHPSEIGEDEGTILLAAVKKRVKRRPCICVKTRRPWCAIRCED